MLYTPLFPVVACLLKPVSGETTSTLAFGTTAPLTSVIVPLRLAQVNVANLNGTITDVSGAVVPNARVEVVSPDTGFKRQATTGNSGVYSINSLPIGKYDLTISAQGFKTYSEKGIELSVGENRTVDAQLAVGMTTTTVEVQGIAQGLESNNAEISTVLHSSQVTDIPLNGRDWATLMTLSPAAVNLGCRGQRDL